MDDPFPALFFWKLSYFKHKGKDWGNSWLLLRPVTEREKSCVSVSVCICGT